jgi:hypothetical protein
VLGQKLYLKKFTLRGAGLITAIIAIDSYYLSKG